VTVQHTTPDSKYIIVSSVLFLLQSLQNTIYIGEQNSCSLSEKMGYSNAPKAYYSTLHDSITSLCKTIIPLGIKKRCLVSAKHSLWKLQSDNLKWQQDSLHQILNLLALHKDDILSEAEFSAFRTHLLDTLLAAPPQQQDHAAIIKDKLMFLQVSGTSFDLIESHFCQHSSSFDIGPF